MTDTEADTELGAAPVDAAVFARRYLAHAGSQLPGRPAPVLAELADDVLKFARVRPWGEALLRVAQRQRPATATVTAVDIVSADAPYIVESLWAEFERTGRGTERMLHPQIVVARDSDGVITRVLRRRRQRRRPRRRDGRVLGAHRARRRPRGPPCRAGRGTAAGARRRPARGGRRAAHVPPDPRTRRRAGCRSRPVRPRDERRGRRAAALVGRRQLHDPRPRRLLGQRAGEPAGPHRRRHGARGCCAARPGSRRWSCCPPTAAALPW